MTNFLTGLIAMLPVFVGLAFISLAAWLAGVVLEDRDARHALEDLEDYEFNHGRPIPPVATTGTYLFHAPEFKDDPVVIREFRQSERFDRIANLIAANEADRMARSDWEAGCRE